MPEQFLHGVEVVQIDNGARPIETVRSSVIGLIGTAPNADVAAFPVNTPVLIAGSMLEAAKLGDEGTLPQAIDGIFDQVGAMVVVVRVEAGVDNDATKSSIIGGVDAATGQYTGVKAFLGAESTVHVQPKILIAPGFTNDAAVVSEMLGIADRLRAVVIVDGPNTTDSAAMTFREGLGSKRVYMVDPWVKVWDTTTSAETPQPASARVAGMIARQDNERGFWWSPSNTEMYGITGTARPVDFSLGDPNCRANLLNENEVATIIRKDGYRLWGNRTCSADPKWAFLNVVRTVDMVNESLLRAHMWAVDRNITKTYVEDVIEGVNAYLRHLKAVGAILGGKCWADKELNGKDQIEAGKVFFDFDLTPPTPAEHIVFRSHLVNDYIETILN